MDTTEAHSLGFGALLKRHRRAAGLTQEALAARARFSVRGVQDLERGASKAPRPATVTLLAAAFGLVERDRVEFVASARLPTPVPTIASASSGGLVSLVGRERELAALRRFLAADGDLPGAPAPPVLLLAGEPGIGKTRLLQAAAQHAAAGGWRVLAGGCHRSGGQEPYAPLLDALARHLHAQAPAVLRADLAGCGWLARLLPELAGKLEPLPSGALPPEQERRLMFAAVARLLVNVAGPAGTLLALDDLQWAGPDALDLLAALLRGATPTAPLRVVGAYRDTEARPADPLGLLVADLARAGLITHQALGPLGPEEAATLLDDLLVGATDDVGHAMAERVLGRAGGVPFFLVSYAQALRLGRAEAVPWDLAQGVRQRVALLPEATQGLLGAAAIVGRRAPCALLAVVVEQSEGPCWTGWKRHAGRDCWWRTGTTPTRSRTTWSARWWRLTWARRGGRCCIAGWPRRWSGWRAWPLRSWPITTREVGRSSGRCHTWSWRGIKLGASARMAPPKRTTP